MNMLLPRDPVKQIPLLVLRNCEADGGNVQYACCCPPVAEIEEVID
jgi:hypothetical protein